MRKVDVLHDLQAVDTGLDQARERWQRIASRWGKRDPVNAAASARDAALTELHHRQADQRALELEIETLRGKIKQNSDKMYGGRVSNPRELSDLSSEVKQDERLMSEREDRLLAVYDVVAAAQAAADTAQAAYGKAEADWKQQQEEMAAERKALEGEVAQLQARRAALVPQADPAALRLYESLRRGKGGLAVVLVSQRSCMGCRIALPANEEQKARQSADIVTCNSCGRILYTGG
jgi:predicted  nucleic acid-binding Zn-ribbon protein